MLERAFLSPAVKIMIVLITVVFLYSNLEQTKLNVRKMTAENTVGTLFLMGNFIVKPLVNKNLVTLLVGLLDPFSIKLRDLMRFAKTVTVLDTGGFRVGLAKGLL
jgi:hypothetical protein